MKWFLNVFSQAFLQRTWDCRVPSNDKKKKKFIFNTESTYFNYLPLFKWNYLIHIKLWVERIGQYFTYIISKCKFFRDWYYWNKTEYFNLDFYNRIIYANFISSQLRKIIFVVPEIYTFFSFGERKKNSNKKCFK